MLAPDSELHASSQPAVTSLDRAPHSEWVKVVEVPRGRGASRNLSQLGLFVNETVRVLNTAPLGGPVLVDVGGSTVAIGRSLASRITVRVVTGKHDGEAR